MTYKQVVPFTPSNGGNRPGFCLQNVRLGYGIASKYANAITAWSNTEQHKDRNVPKGVDVPLYYSYKTDGHINVRLANGKVWSDGNLYSSIEDYEAKSTPIYLGWGESVNDVRVIKESEVHECKEEEYKAAAVYWEKKARARLAVAAEQEKKIKELEQQLAASQGEFVQVGELFVRKG